MELIQKIFSLNPLERLIYRPLGLNKNSAPAFWFSLFGLLLVYTLLILTGGNIKMAGLALLPSMCFCFAYSFLISLASLVLILLLIQPTILEI